MDGQGPTRRTLLAAGGAGLLGLGLGACGREEETALIASAARNGNRQTFVDTVGWQDAGGKALTVAFVPWLLSEEERRAAVENRGVYPALSFERPLLEVRFELEGQPGGVQKVSTAALRALQFTFWFFDDPTPVIRVEQDEWPSSPEMEVVGLDGEVRRGGWVLGTIRGRRLYRSARNVEEAYLVNLRFVQSLA
jgi:hypothetical protein